MNVDELIKEIDKLYNKPLLKFKIHLQKFSVKELKQLRNWFHNDYFMRVDMKYSNQMVNKSSNRAQKVDEVLNDLLQAKKEG